MFGNSLTGDVDAKYSQLWALLEESACAKLPFPVSKQVRGRAQTVSTKAVKFGQFAPVRIGRSGEFQPHFHGSSLRYSQWVRQVRRLQAFCRCIGDANPPSKHSVLVWGSIVRALGLQGFFQLVGLMPAQSAWGSTSVAMGASTTCFGPHNF